MFYVKAPVLCLNDTSIEYNAIYLLHVRAVKVMYGIETSCWSQEMEDGKNNILLYHPPFTGPGRINREM